MRTEFSTRIRRQALERSAGRCEGTGPEVGLPAGERCGASLGYGLQIDHILPDTMGGEATLDNAQCLCGACWRFKNAQDWKAAAKSNRQRDKHTGARAPSKRPMPGGRSSAWRRRMDGTVEPRRG